MTFRQPASAYQNAAHVAAEPEAQLPTPVINLFVGIFTEVGLGSCM